MTTQNFLCARCLNSGVYPGQQRHRPWLRCQSCAITITDDRTAEEIAEELTLPVLILVYAKSSIHLIPYSLNRAAKLMQGQR